MKKSIVSFLILCGVLSASCTSNGDETVTCTDTNLMWQDNTEVNTNRQNWQNAIKYCESLDLAGHTDWRLPNIIELKSITDKIKKANPSLKDGFTQKSTNYFWSSTTLLSDTSHAWSVDFYYGTDTLKHKSKSFFTSVRCVR